MTPQELRAARQRTGWSQQKLSMISGVNKAYISEMETGLRVDKQREYDLLVALESAKSCPMCGRPL